MTVSDASRSVWTGPVPTAAALAVVAVVLVACSSSTTGSPTTSTTATTSPTSPPASSTSTSTTGTPAPTPSARNLPVTDAVRSQLVAARAAQIGVAPTTFTGLAPGSTYYALDTATGTYWAAGRMAFPDTVAGVGGDLYKAQVASQDAGSYLVFSQPRGGSWTVAAVGSSGPQSPCGVTVPPAVTQVWGWPAGSCRPAGH